MNEVRTIAISTVAVYLVWSLVLIGLIAGWVVTAVGHPHVAAMLGITTCVLTGVAAVGTVRCYFNRISGLIRALHRVEDPRTPDLHPVRP